jgi:hypothetical protein
MLVGRLVARQQICSHIEGEKRYACDILIYRRTSTFSADGGIKVTCTLICGKESTR